MANRSHKPTDASRNEVKAYAVVGTPHHLIASLVGVSIKTLLKHYRDELDTAKAKANAHVGKTLFNQAISGNTAAAIFWMKAQAGWRERIDVEHGGAVNLNVVQVPPPAGGIAEWLSLTSSGGPAVGPSTSS